MSDFGSVKRTFETEIDRARDDVGAINIAVFGNTGVGKSTLLNAVFGADKAPTGTGNSVTAHIRYHGGPPEPLGIYDTPGFEIGGSEKALLSEIDQIFKNNRSKPLAEQIHVIWFVENSQGHRFVDSSARLVKRLSSFGVPVMVILTRTRITKDGEIASSARELAQSIVDRGLPISPKDTVFCVNALADPEFGDPSHGLANLLDATFATVPESVHEALVAAQQLDMERKRRQAQKIINRSTVGSGAAGATPIPLTDIVLLVTSITRMFARISAAYGVPVQRKHMAQLATAVVITGGTSAASTKLVTTVTAKQIAKASGKFIPLVNLAAAAISGLSAAAITRTAGHAWARMCEHMVLNQNGDIDEQTAIEVFRKNFTPS